MDFDGFCRLSADKSAVAGIADHDTAIPNTIATKRMRA